MPEPADLPLALMRMLNGFQVSQALSAVVTLRIPDRLASGPRSSEQLAADTETHAPSLYRLLRAVAALGVFEERPGRSFAATPLSELLRSDRPLSLAGWATFIGRPYYWQAWSHLLHSVRTGETAFTDLNGVDVWAYRAERPDESAIFDAAMTSLSRFQAIALLAGYDFARFRRIADIGGGRGALLAAILQKHTGAEGILFDQPHVVAGAGELLRGAGVDGRCRVVGGSFFESVPEADAYLLRGVLHDWDDERSAAILRTIHAAAPSGARLLVIEQLIEPPNQGAPAKLSDLNMLVSPGGRERTREEFAALFEAGGFTLTGVHAAGRTYVIEGVPA